ncbi:Hypothetical protein CAP_6966 [Chondromyces apiculatus DSM 436]|uniref:Uncharacterized protein n=1 Tax=Chondromyces apiculatus DSM 436 TaxID=1192034 RepID=A0A017TFC3_9BACT|nr:Hypothetical protein CAP_6966 [Chondromyces apiculatus DSM 436]
MQPEVGHVGRLWVPEDPEHAAHGRRSSTKPARSPLGLNTMGGTFVGCSSCAHAKLS